MPRTCIAKNCNYEYKKEVRIKIFSFPQDKILQCFWLRNMKVRETYKPSAVSSFGICEQHFLKKCCYDYEQGAQLKPNAVPTLLLAENSRHWQKIAPDSDALLEENEENVETPQPQSVKDLRPRVEHDHSYLEESATLPPTKASPKKPPNQTKANFASLKSEIAQLKQEVISKNIQLKRLEGNMRKKDSRKEDLEYAVEKLKAILQCCECGLKPASEAELAKTLKRKTNDGEGPSSKKVKSGTQNAPTQVICRNDLVVGLTWKQLFGRVHSLTQE